MRFARLMQDAGGEEAEVEHRARDIEPARERDRLAVVDRLEPGELLEIRFDQIGELQQQPAALRGGRARPGGERCLRRLHRIVNILTIAVGNRRDALFRRRIDVVDVIAGMRWDEAAADEITEWQGTPPDRTPSGRCRDPTSPTARSPPSARAVAAE